MWTGVCTPTTRRVWTRLAPRRVADIPLCFLFVQGVAVSSEGSLFFRNVRTIEHAMFVLTAQSAAPAVRGLREEVLSEFSLVWFQPC